MSNTNPLVQKLWSFCDNLRDEGVSYGDYVEQLTYLLFLKIAYEYEQADEPKIKIPAQYTWQSLLDTNGADLLDHYKNLLNDLGKEPETMLGKIFTQAQNKIQNPAQLSKLIKLIDAESWASMKADLKGDIYEGLLEKNAQDVKSGAGQYFTSRSLIQTIVQCINPKPLRTIGDPACGTGGFFLGAYEYLAPRMRTKKELDFLRKETFWGWEIVANTQRLCLMNLLLHGIGDINMPPPVVRKDSLMEQPSQTFDYVFTNPPFGKKSSYNVRAEDDESNEDKDELVYNRQDFWVTTNNKQLNFMQHILSMLKVNGEAAVVLPDNVLFEGGAGEIIRKKLMEKADLHTILRLPTGIFYANGVKANVLFFQLKAEQTTPATTAIWYYDYRTNIRHTLKKNPLKLDDLRDFIDCYNPQNRHKRAATYTAKNPTGRWRKYSYQELLDRDKTSLDIFWLKDNNTLNLDNLPEPDALAEDIIRQLQSALKRFEFIQKNL